MSLSSAFLSFRRINPFFVRRLNHINTLFVNASYKGNLMTTRFETKTALQLFDEFEMEHKIKTSLLQASESVALNWVLRVKHETENDLKATGPVLEGKK